MEIITLSDAQKLGHVHWTSSFRLASEREEYILRLAVLMILYDLLLDYIGSLPRNLWSCASSQLSHVMGH